MVRTKFFRRMATAVAFAGLTAPQFANASDIPVAPSQTVASAAVSDVALRDGGLLVGQVVDSQGVIQANVPVKIYSQGQVVASAYTNDQGEFAVQGLRGGVHTVESQQVSNTYRLWAPRTAPPAATDGVLMVQGNPTTYRGQTGGSSGGSFLMGGIFGGLLTGGLYAALDYNKPGS